jgi:hypothetical protein
MELVLESELEGLAELAEKGQKLSQSDRMHLP